MRRRPSKYAGAKVSHSEVSALVSKRNQLRGWLRMPNRTRAEYSAWRRKMDALDKSLISLGVPLTEVRAVV